MITQDGKDAFKTIGLIVLIVIVLSGLTIGVVLYLAGGLVGL